MSAELVIDNVCVGSRTANRNAILDYEEFAKTQVQLDIPVIHRIHGGMYAREITIPKGTILTGQIYKFDHLDIMISGDITVSTDTGERKRLQGYNCFEGLSGKKRAGYAHEDTTWITVHPVTGPDGDTIQDHITVDTFDELNEFNAAINRSDYEFLIADIGINQLEVDEQVNNKGDQIPMPEGFENVVVKPSIIDGNGLFSTTEVGAGCKIAPARIDGKRTPAGRYTNHALRPNAHFMYNGDDMYLYALEAICPGDEITVSYRDTIFTRSCELCQE